MVWSQWRQIWAGGLLGGALGVAMLLCGERPALAIDPIPYELDNVSFTTASGTALLDGTFRLPCGSDSSVNDCVTYDNPTAAAPIEPGWTLFEGNGESYVYKTLEFSPGELTFSYPPFYGANTFVNITSALYGYDFIDQRYFLAFQFTDGNGGLQDFNVFLYLDGVTGNAIQNPSGSYLPPVGRTFNGFYDPPGTGPTGSTLCANPLPNTAANSCPNSDKQNIPILSFNGQVLNTVPAPFSAVLLLPAAGLLRLRRRYRRP